MVYESKMNIDQFLLLRPAVLDTWKTGHEVANLDKQFDYCRSLPKSKSLPAALTDAQRRQRTLIQPRGGACLIDDHLRSLKTHQNEGGADILSTTIDQATRYNHYTEAQKAIDESRAVGRSLSNGFPVVNYGAAACRGVIEALEKPVQIRHATPDARLLAEISFAAGFSGFEGGGISFNVPYVKDVTIENSILYWQYVDRLAGWYTEQGIVINREPFGTLTGTMVPPCISLAISILEALLAAQQGVLDITLGYGQAGNLYQDIAAMRTLKTLGRQYLDRFGFSSVTLSTAMYQWMAGFPTEESKAYALIAWGSCLAAWSGATKVITKTAQEALRDPAPDAAINGLKITRQMLNMVENQRLDDGSTLQQEMEQLTNETSSILEATIACGQGSIAGGVIKAFNSGILDVPFAPTRYVQGQVLPVRDSAGAVRFFEFGELPFSKEIKEFHKQKLVERSKQEKRAVSFQMVTDDIYAVSKGLLVGVPECR